MEKLVIHLPRGSLASRSLAKIQRKKIAAIVAVGNVKLHFDFAQVDAISESYSDELFGVLVLNNGMDKVLNCIRLDNADESTLESIATVIQRRENDRNNTFVVI